MAPPPPAPVVPVSPRDLARDVIGVVLGGGRGTRLYPLTKMRAKPAVALAGKYRLVDIPISSCLHSGVDRIFVLTQFQSGSLNRHIFRTYRFESFGRGFIEVLAAHQADPEHAHEVPGLEGGWYEGTADAVRRNLREFTLHRSEEVLILAGDHIYRMDFGLFIGTHRHAEADITVAVTPVRRAQATGFGILKLGQDGRIVRFVEKPKDPAVLDDMAVPGLPDGCTHVASMGIYAIRKDRLADLVAPHQMKDFGKDVIPSALAQGRLRVQAHVYAGYWEDIGTIASYYAANLRLAEGDPPFDLYDQERPIYTRPRFLPPTRFDGVKLDQTLIADGCFLQGCEITHSVIGIRSIIRRGARIADSIVIGNDSYEERPGPTSRAEIPLGIGPDCEIRRSIIDKDVRIGRGVRIINKDGADERDGERYVIRDGIVCIPKGTTIPDGTVI